MSRPKAVIYTRVSSERQAEEGTSLETQRQSCLKKAGELGASVVECLADEGITGATLAGRPSLQRALALIEEGQANVLLCYDLSRLSRNVEHQSIIKRRVEAAGGRLVFVMGQYSDDEEGQLFYTIDGGFRQYERSVIRRRTMNGRLKRAEEGQQPCRSRSPFGYHVVTKDDVLRGDYPAHQLGRYIVIEEQAAIVREVFQRYAFDRQSLRQISLWLDAQGIETPFGGKRWYLTTVRVMIGNPIYKGVAAFGRTECLHNEERIQSGMKSRYYRKRTEEEWTILEAPAIVEPGIWQRCQEKLAGNKTELTGRPGRKYLLSGLFRCPVCGKSMRYCHNKRSTTYRCDDKHPEAARQCYPAKRYNPWVLRAVVHMAEHPESLEKAFRIYSQRQRTNADTPEKIEAELKALSERERAVVQAQISGIQAGADPAIYAAMFADISQKRATLQVRYEAVKNAQVQEFPKDEAGKLRQAIEDMRAILTDETVDDAIKNPILHRIIKTIVPDGEELDITFAPFGNPKSVHSITMPPTMAHVVSISPRPLRVSQSAAR